MVTNNKRFAASELDFDALKANLKNYLQGQTEFTDHNFEGSNLSVLLDILTYNTHYRGLYDNFILNETFLESASKRDNVVSRAKELGYTPLSTTAAIAYVTLTLSGVSGGPSILELPKLSQFSAAINGTETPFITVENYTAPLVGTTYTFENVKIVQGRQLTDRFDYLSGSRYITKSKNIDISTLTLKVQEHSQSTKYDTYIQELGIVGVTSTDTVFWVKEVNDGFYEVEFGNDVIGKSLISGNIIHMEYIVNEASAGNGARLFKYNGSNIYGGAASVTTVAVSSGGKEIENIDSIKFNAPRLYSTQNRAVTVEDYKNLVYTLVNEAQSVNVWSGEDANPPEYGKVFICIKPKTVEKFTNIEKLTIKNDIIGSKNLLTVIPEIIDPTYIKVGVNVTVYYDQKSTTKSSNDLKNIVTAAILDYNDTHLLKFEGVFRYSKFTGHVDESDASITSNITSVVIRRKIVPKFDMLGTYLVNLVNPIHNTEGAVKSSGFYVLGSNEVHYIEDDTLGNLYLYHSVNSVKQIVNSNIGTVNYGTGVIKISGIHITSLVGNEFELSIKPSSNDIISSLDQLVIIPPELITINVLSNSSANAQYNFTPSH